MTNEASKAERDMAIGGLTGAQRVVETATEHIDEVGWHFRESLNATRRPVSVLKFLEDMTRASPLAMLGVAFITGVVVVRRR
jgi:hypothetical protein